MGDLSRSVNDFKRVDYPAEKINFIKSLEVPEVEDITKDSYGRLMSFDGNKRVKPSGMVIDYTETMVREIVKCKKDPLYFSKYFYIIDKDTGRQPIKLYDFQYSLLKHFVDNRYSVALTPRQVGKCVSNATYKLRNKHTGEIVEMSAEDFHELTKRDHQLSCEICVM